MGAVSGRDPRRIGVIAVRTAPGVPQASSDKLAEAIVIGEVAVAGGGVIDPNVPHPPAFTWEWRYACFSLPDFERLLAKARADLANNVPVMDIVHPLEGPQSARLAPFHPGYYDRFGDSPAAGLGSDEADDLLSSDDLDGALIAELRAKINPPIDDAGTPSTTGVSRISYAIALRDVVRLAIFSQENQPLGAGANSDGGPLLVLDTCRYVDLDSTETAPSAPGPTTNKIGSRIVLVTDPLQIDQDGPNKSKLTSAQGKLFGFALLPEVRLLLNADDANNNPTQYEGTQRGFLRFFGVRSEPQRFLFDHAASHDLRGPRFDSMRLGCTTSSQAKKFIDAMRGKFAIDLCQRDGRLLEPVLAGSTSKNCAILDQLKVGTGTTCIRTFGFRLIDSARMTLRFEAVYQANVSDLRIDYAPTAALQNASGWIRFAQEQPGSAVNWNLQPQRAVRWMFTARHFEKDFAADSAITAAIVTAWNYRASRINSGLRQSRDATPISFLPYIELLDAVNSAAAGAAVAGVQLLPPAWHFVGELRDRMPYDRLIGVNAAIADPARRQIDAEFLTLEPRFIQDMYHPERFLFNAESQQPRGPHGILGEYGFLATAKFPRVGLTTKKSTNDLLTYRVILSAPIFTDPTEAKPAPSVFPPAFQPAMSGRTASTAYRGVFLGIKVLTNTTPISSQVRIGALELEFAESFPVDTPPVFGAADGILRLLALKPDPTDPDPSLAESGLDSLIKLPLCRVSPGGQDDLPSDAQITAEDRVLDALRDSGPDPNAPIILPLQLPSAMSSRLTLYANETVARHRNQTVALSIKAIQTLAAAGGASTAPVASASAAELTAPANATPGRLLVIDPAPFRIAVVKTRDLAAAQTSESDEVAVWNAEGENGLSWRIVDDTSTVSLLLPPQVIGEAMEKNAASDSSRPPDVAENTPAAARLGSLTRLDLDPSNFDTRYVEPGWNLRRLMGYAGQRAPGAGLRDLRLELMYGMLTRLTPQTAGVQVAEIGAVIGAPAINLSADATAPVVSAYIQAFNAMRLAQNRRLAVDRLWQGDPLGELTIEQGASFALRTRGAQTVNVAIGGTARLGDQLNLSVVLNDRSLPVLLSADVPDPATIGGSDTDKNAHALAAALKNLADAVNGNTDLTKAGVSAKPSPPASFDLALAPSARSVSVGVIGAGATTTLSIDGGYSTAQSGPLTPFRWPTPGGIPVDLDPALKDSFRADASDRSSFAGGVPWAFESPNILRSTYRKLTSDGGRARAVHLSALGGWGNQRGLFDLDKTAIETETTMGRVHRYALERIGRIGSLWHRAKHVIVYERTVSPSAQFYNDGAIGKQQDQLLGRPVLRKVEEYVELLQQVRRYPEQGSAIEAAGCLTGAEFISRRIRVDSRWGGDVRDQGWQVPLWNKKFDIPPTDPKNPDDPAFVYPKPQIRFLVMGEGNVEKALEIAEPEKLLFYTSVLTTDTGDNTDAWRPVRDIDFVDLPLPQAGKRRPQSGDLHDGQLPPEPPHIAGYERFTIGIVPSKETVAITHGRQDKGPVASLRNITIGRSAGIPSKPASGPPTPTDIVSQVGGAILTLRLGRDGIVGLDGITSQLNEAARAAAMAKGATPATIKAAVQAAVGSTLPQKLTDLTASTDFNWPASSTIAGLTKKLCDEQVGRIGAEIDAQFGRATKQINGWFDQLDGVLSAEVDAIQAVISDLSRQTADSKSLAKQFVQGLAARVGDIVASADASLSQAKANVDALANKVSSDVNSVVSTLQQPINNVDHAVQLVLDNIATQPAKIPALLTDALKAVQPLRRQIGPLIADAAANSLQPTTRTVLLVVDHALIDIEAAIAKAQKDWGHVAIQAFQAEINALKILSNNISVGLQNRIALAATGAGTALSSAQGAIDGAAKSATDAVGAALTPIQNDLGTLANRIDDTFPTDTIIAELLKQAGKISQISGNLRKTFAAATTALLQPKVKAAKEALTAKANQACGVFEGALDDVYAKASNAKAWIDAQLATYETQLDQALDGIAADAADLAQSAQDAISQVGRQIESRAREALGGLQQRAADYLNGRDPTQVAAEMAAQAATVFQQGSDTLRLLRAIGDPPKTNQLGFNRPQVAYVFQEANKIVDMTPAISLVNRVADSAAAVGAAAASANDLLTSFGIRLPASAIGDQLIPDPLKNLDISKLFPDFSGIKLDGLFKNLGFPDLTDSDAVKVRHGFDQVELNAWLEADIDVPFASDAPLMNFGPVQILIDQARFTSSARISEGRAGTQKSMNGRLFGDWRLVCAGQTILTFVQTALTFDQTGRLKFDIQPDRVQLAAALQFLTDLVQATGEDGDFEIVPYMLGSVPSGVAARLDMELPPIQTGVFGICDLSLHILFGVTALPEFEIVTELGVGAMLAPFTLNVWILNGGGYVTSRLSYLPMHKPAALLTFTLEVGIVAGVGLGFTFGVVSGGVWIQVGCAIAITWTTGAGGSTTAVTVFLLVRGNVDVAGLITVGLSLLLAITYDGNKMVASGTLNLSIKISVFFTLSVSEHVEYDFAGGQAKSSSNYSESYA